MFCLAEGRYLPGTDSSVNGLLRFIIAHQKTGRASLDLLTGLSKSLHCTSPKGGPAGLNPCADPTIKTTTSPISCPPDMTDATGNVAKPSHQNIGGPRTNEAKDAAEDVRKTPSASMSSGQKRRHVEDDTLDLLYESEGELGALASGKKVHLTRSDIVAMWEQHPLFLHFGFQEDVQLAPPRFRNHVTMKGRCTFCGVTAHKSLKGCKTWQRLTQEHTEDVSKWEDQCVYPFCEQPKRHRVRACITLHSKCGKCSKRGHGTERCPATPDEWREVKRVYEEFSMQGSFTRLASKDPAWGWDYNPSERLRNMVIFKGKKAR